MSDDQPDWPPPALHLLPRQREAPTLIGAPATLPLLIGRETEIQAVLTLLRQPTCRLQTLTGPGGIGKTRLALAAAAEVAGVYADGAVYVPLDALRDPPSVIPAIAVALGVREASGRSLREILGHALRDRQQLLVLDNFEHVVAAATDIAVLLEASPGLTVLVTSRVPLRLQAEQRFPTPPLTVPSTSQAAPEALLAHDAVALFVERARRVQPDFQITEANAAAVVALVQHLEGIPLAIELAAAWSHVLSPQALLVRLTRRLDVLTGGPTDQPPRLQSMREAIAWSYALLADDEQQLFRCLGVFVGGFRLEAAEAVGSVAPHPGTGSGSAGSPVWPLLARLVEASLVQRVGTEAQEPRYLLLETVREFAREQLHAHGEEDHVAHRHAQWVQTLVETVEPHLLGPREIEHQDVIRVELGNLRAALTWSTVHDPQIAVRMGGLLWVFWIYQGLIAEGFQWTTTALATGAGTSTERANAMVTAAALAMMQADTERATPLVRDASALVETLNDPVLRARLWFVRGTVILQHGQFAETADAFHRAVAGYALATTTTDRTMQAWSRACQGVATAGAGDLPAAVAIYELARMDATQAGSRFVEALILCDFAGLLLDVGDLTRAKDLMTEVLRLATDFQRMGHLGEVWLVSHSLFVLAAIDVREQQFMRAARSVGAAETVMNRLGLVLTPPLQVRADQTMLQLSVGLRSDLVTSFKSEGNANPVAAIADLLRGHTSLTPGASGFRDSSQGLVSAREQQILQLVAAGRSDRQIAEALFISRKTVSNHVANILHKLEVPTRAAAVARAVSVGLITTAQASEPFPSTR